LAIASCKEELAEADELALKGLFIILEKSGAPGRYKFCRFAKAAFIEEDPDELPPSMPERLLSYEVAL
jgi:hypothetical protein